MGGIPLYCLQCVMFLHIESLGATHNPQFHTDKSWYHDVYYVPVALDRGITIFPL